MAVSMNDVKKLREMTGAGMLDCKKALEEAQGDIEKAKEILRVKGLAKAEKKASRETKEGLIVVKVTEDRKKGAMIELNCETDFVARNEEFQALAEAILEHVLTVDENADKQGDGSEILAQKFFKDESKTIEELIKEAIAKIGENIRLSRYCRYDTQDYLHSYVHGGGRIGVLLDFKAPEVNEQVLRLVQDIAMQIAAMRPEFVSIDTIPAEALEREKRILMEQARQEGKPENILEKIVQGKLKKFYQEKVLLEQAFIKDDKKTVGQVIRESGLGVDIKRFCRFELGGL
ncbi:translation elongation factor Ts (EF-Ts) [Hydrogenivirga caldilitoris]|uniref:Elongation factor Ts n=1 Tax=Hydrogenivirga caldilitoris TaxID=246264 RepID=A0A497XNS5_9AQUI|nr:translation elongation factor Ts [Hydrogenivirga caldilitoris]RLJ69911.1 translation elongation factor Ts (EF-Ts) [Hydrogenivirga caldilitoris]